LHALSSIRTAGLALASVLFVQLAGTAAAGQDQGLYLRPGRPSAVVLASGAANLARPSDELQLNWELHFDRRDFSLFSGRLSLQDMIPIAGVMAAADGSMYAYAGARVERPLGRGWLFSPSFAAGLYYRDAGKILGGVLEFRSGLELTYQLRRGRHLGAALYHLSNGSFYDSNPGTESLLVTYRAGLR
jgi:hypothetical protein